MLRKIREEGNTLQIPFKEQTVLWDLKLLLLCYLTKYYEYTTRTNRVIWGEFGNYVVFVDVVVEVSEEQVLLLHLGAIEKNSGK